MTFAASDLKLMASSNQSGLYICKTDDDAAAVEGSGYFDAAARYLKQGDIILCLTDQDNTTPADRSLKIYNVVENTGGVVTIAPAK